MSYIKEIINDVEPPKSIWSPCLYKDYHGRTSLRFPRGDFKCTVNVDNEHLRKIIEDHIYFRFDITMLKFTIDTDNAYYRIRSEMRRNIIDTYEENSTKLHPLKTKVGKWLNESNFLENSDTEVVIYNLWKYIQENKGDDFHMNNAFKIMEVLYTKYSDKYETPNARRRRMRRW